MRLTIRKLTHILVAALNLIDTLMLDSALRSFGTPSPHHILHHYSNHLNLILVLRILGSALIVILVIKTKRISTPLFVLGVIAVVMASKMVYDNYMYLILE